MCRFDIYRSTGVLTGMTIGAEPQGSQEEKVGPPVNQSGSSSQKSWPTADTEGMKGFSEIRILATKLLSSSFEALEKETATASKAVKK